MFNVTDTLQLTHVNTSGAKDLAVLYALYPDCQHSIPNILKAIVEENTPGKKVATTDAGQAHKLLLSRITSYNQVAFHKLSHEQQKKVIRALDADIAHRETEASKTRHYLLESKGASEAFMALNTSERAEIRGHVAWLNNLKVFRQHAMRSYGIAQMQNRQQKRTQLKEILYRYIEELPADFFTWDNVEDRILRVLFESHVVSSAVSLPGNSMYFNAFPIEVYKSAVASKSVLAGHAPAISAKRVCIFENTSTLFGSQPEINVVTTFPKKVIEDSQVSKIVNILASRVQQAILSSPKSHKSHKSPKTTSTTSHKQQRHEPHTTFKKSHKVDGSNHNHYQKQKFKSQSTNNRPPFRSKPNPNANSKRKKKLKTNKGSYKTHSHHSRTAKRKHVF